MIQNDVENKFTGQVSTLLQYQYHGDQHQIPRFHKHGVAKTPPQEQLWYTPLDENGRCDWRAIVARWAGGRGSFSVIGWNDRYLKNVWVDSLMQHRTSVKILNIHKRITFRHRELNWSYRYFRQKRGSLMAWPLHFLWFWTLIVGGSAASIASYQMLNWEDDPWNYDMHYMK
eukprot:UN24826